MDKLLLQITQKPIPCPSVKSLNPIFRMNNSSRIMERNFLARKIQNRSSACFTNIKKLFKSYRMQLSGKMYSISKNKIQKSHR